MFVRRVVLILLVLLLCGSAAAELYYCDIEDVGTLAPGQFEFKIGLTHYWQGAVGGVRTNNTDRIVGLYDFDLYYLLFSEQSENRNGDYTLVAASLQPSFGSGLNTSKIGSFYELNDGAKGDNVLIDKLYIEFTTLDRLFTFDIGKIEIADMFDSSAVAHCEKSQFFAEPLVHNLAIPFAKHGLGIRGLWQPNKFFYAQAAVGDTQAVKKETGFRTAFHDDDYFFGIAEVGIMPNMLNLPGTYRFILWYDPQSKSYLDGSSRTKRDDLGVAISFDQKLNDKITGFLRYGWADDKVNETEDFISFGGQIEGLIEGREEDVFAVGYVSGLRSPEGLSAQAERQIDLIEAYYSIVINDNLIITPNIQFVMDPGGVKNESPATVFGVRTRIKF